MVSDYAAERSELYLEIQCFSAPFDMLEEMDRSGVPDIALLDICMPGVLGTKVARGKSGVKSGDTTDIVFLTTSSDFAVEAFELHANDYLTKPFTKERLTDTLDRIIEKKTEASVHYRSMRQRNPPH